MIAVNLWGGTDAKINREIIQRDDLDECVGAHRPSMAEGHYRAWRRDYAGMGGRTGLVPIPSDHVAAVGLKRQLRLAGQPKRDRN
jgi:hypothetical protein